jgi:TolB-like protein
MIGLLVPAQTADRLDSWKEIAAYLRRSVRTVRRWERDEGLPVHRQMHRSLASVYAYRSEIDAWRRRDERAAVASAPAAAAAPATAAAPLQAPSIAVLPFSYVGPASGDEYLADGFTEEVIAALSKLRSVRVISRTSSMALRGTSQGASAIGRALRVRHLLEGTVRRHGGRLRVSTRLTDAERDDRLWADTYEGALDDVLAIQERIARQIVRALEVELTPEEDRRLAERPIDDIVAWRCAMQARQEALRWRRESIDDAIRLLRNGLAVVGDNAELNAALGRTHLQYREAGLDLGEGPLEEAERSAREVFAIDPGSAAGLRLRGWIHYSRSRIQDAVRDLAAALETDWNDPDTLGLLSNCYLIPGRGAGGRRVP